MPQAAPVGWKNNIFIAYIAANLFNAPKAQGERPSQTAKLKLSLFMTSSKLCKILARHLPQVAEVALSPAKKRATQNFRCGSSIKF